MEYWSLLVLLITITITIITKLPISPFNFINFCFMYFQGSVVRFACVYKHYFFLMDYPFYHYECPFLSLITILVLKSILSDISIAIHTLFGYYLHDVPFRDSVLSTHLCL